MSYSRMDANRIAALILTFNEELHLGRTLSNLSKCVDEIHIVDSYSTDRTLDIAAEYGAFIYQNPWKNYATQLQWAIDNCNINAEWIMRHDADEYLTEELIAELSTRLANVGSEVSGIVLKRRVYFMGKWIRFGGYYPIKLLRLWRVGSGFVEQRFMDEHVVLKYGSTVEFEYDLIDENLNNLSWWTAKHNGYALREAIDLLNSEYNLFEGENLDSNLTSKDQAARKRWMKSNVYMKAPLFLRSFLYFNYRYWIKLGFMDGTKGLIWHFLQGFWYRFLVDAFIYNIKFRARESGRDIARVIEEDYGYKISER